MPCQSFQVVWVARGRAGEAVAEGEGEAEGEREREEVVRNMRVRG